MWSISRGLGTRTTCRGASTCVQNLPSMLNCHASGFGVLAKMLDDEGFTAAALYPSKFLYLPFANGVAV